MNTRVKKLAYTALFTVIIIACSFIRIPIPLIPFTLQVFAVLMAGLVLGPWLGAGSVLLYIALGFTGLPIFAGGGGIGYVMMPSFGYMIGFIFAAMLTGFMARKSKGKYWQLIISCLAGCAVIYAFGLPYFYLMVNFSMGVPKSVGAVLMTGFVVTLPGDIAKIILAAAVALKLKPLIERSYCKTVPPRECADSGAPDALQSNSEESPAQAAAGADMATCGVITTDNNDKALIADGNATDAIVK